MANFQEIQRAILQTLAYADVFDYPLTAPEIRRYLTRVSVSQAEVENVLREMAPAVTKVGDVYVLPSREAHAETRQRRAEVASRLWPKALRYGRMIASLPFVRMVAVTGSLAMDNADEGRDIDYFLVTVPGYLWTCRALILIIFRIARLDGVTLCPNFLVTENVLGLRDHSLYAAHELVQMVPLAGLSIYDKMRSLNAWTDEFLPNADGAPAHGRTPQTPIRFQQMLESVLRILPVQTFERWEMKRKIARFTQQAGFGTETNFSADVCQGNFDHHGSRTNTAFEDRLLSLEIISPLRAGEGQGKGS